MNADAATQLIFKALQIGSELASTPHLAAATFISSSSRPLLPLHTPSRQVGNRRLPFFPSWPPFVFFLHETQPAASTKEMGGFDQQVKERTKELKHLKDKAMRGIKVAGESCKKAWNKVRSSIKR